MSLRAGVTLEKLAHRGDGFLPGLIGVRFTALTESEVDAELDIRTELLAPNGYLHAASVIALADTACGYGCLAHLPAGAENFTTVELKSNFLGTVRGGTISLRRDAGAPGQRDPGLGCRRERSRDRQKNRAVPMHADGAVAAQGVTGGPPNLTLGVSRQGIWSTVHSSSNASHRAAAPMPGAHPMMAANLRAGSAEPGLDCR